ncbi:uncharacterized protein LOC131857052 [Cryptomeria japonica]|uniref:uncharacterized protein LOC131857052 n=1 Tax=Cryptomeria japonica TaxID=3369 RepID=UPI0027DAA359|nr:uncharacterized protein LOC131857052 [Cryptomeria japonica]
MWIRWSQISIPFKGVLVGKKSKKDSRKQVKWEEPLNSFLKLNFDGASKGNPGRSGAGRVLTDQNGLIVKAASYRLPNGSNNLIEARELLEVVKIASNMGLSKLHIGGDSQIITSGLISKKVTNWELQFVLGEVWNLLLRFDDFKISHYYREANQLADGLSDLG